MPRRPVVARERLAQLLHLPATAIARKLGCTPNHVNVLLRQHGLTCAPAGCGRPAGIRFTPSPEQRAVMEQFQASRALVSGLASAVGCAPARLFDELSGRVPMPEHRVVALARLLAASSPRAGHGRAPKLDLARLRVAGPSALGLGWDEGTQV